MTETWLRHVGTREGRLPGGTLAVCFPPTGAHGATFADWRGALPADTSLALVTPPGRGHRIDEEAVTDVAAYAESVAAELREQAPGTRLVLIGVSLGALLAYETARRLLDGGTPVARLCAVAGQAPCDVGGGRAEVTLDDARAFVRDTALTDPELLADPDFEEVLLPPVLADLRLAAAYDGSGAPALPVELIAVHATDDPHVPEPDVRRWTAYTTSRSAVLPVPGGHYAHQENPQAALTTCLDPLPGADGDGRPGDGGGAGGGRPADGGRPGGPRGSGGPGGPGGPASPGGGGRERSPGGVGRAVLSVPGEDPADGGSGGPGGDAGPGRYGTGQEGAPDGSPGPYRDGADGGRTRRSVLGTGAAVAAGLVASSAAATATAPKATAAPGGAAAPKVAAAPVPPGGGSFGGDPTDPLALAVAMVRHDTSNPGDGAVTLPHARMLRGLFEGAGVRTEIVPTPKKDNVHFFARVPAHGEPRAKPLVLLGHSDVVPATGDTWEKEPFAGLVEDGRLYGRGALDMKGVNASFVAALLRHVKDGARFDRDIVFWSDCDEEQGPHGVRWLLGEQPERAEAGAVLTEGGWVLDQQGGQGGQGGQGAGKAMIATLTCNDKRSIGLRVTASSYATHTSKPFRGQALVRLGHVLELLDGWRPHIRPNALSRRYFAELAEATDDRAFGRAIRAMLEARTEQARDRAGEEVVRLSATPELHHAMLRSTTAFTGSRAGYYPSIVPGTATAELRVAFLPGGDDPGRTVAELRALIGDRAELSVVSKPGETEKQTVEQLRRDLSVRDSSTDTDVFRAWQRAVRRTHPGVRATACQFEASTSAVPFREKGVPVYGIYPFTVTREMTRRMHGTDEYISVEALRHGTETVHALLGELRRRP
ncbi:M20/M25/M40 family metallo-hydrolase [Streptomyces sp. NPDC048172]|uniref:M20/M25/M40 family metallo-hydrolase n=1 Tax=Streptomyces sp. NPDC048172 TaxID=3365505 RepID=UPI00370FA554